MHNSSLFASLPGLLCLLGFVIASIIFVIATMLAMGERRPLWIVLTSAGITGFIYVVFTVIMGVILPQGRLF